MGVTRKWRASGILPHGPSGKMGVRGRRAAIFHLAATFG